ncbi:transposable element Tcb2 transposase [Trichonephila clavipes]|nr:transposable element Tcb2 transposase [Trichonephila clavipes]
MGIRIVANFRKPAWCAGKPVKRRCWDQWIQEISFTRRPGSGRLRQTSHREDRHIVGKANCFISRPPGTGSTFIRGPCVFTKKRRRLVKGHEGSRCSLRVLPLTPTHQRLHLEWCRARGSCTAAEWNLVVLSDESRFNFSSHDNRVRVWRPRFERITPLPLYSDTPLSQLNGLQLAEVVLNFSPTHPRPMVIPCVIVTA